jgi:hypothetical protein
MYYAVNPLILWKEKGISSYNRSTLAQSALFSYYRTIEFLETQNPKVLFLYPAYLVNFEIGIYDYADKITLDSMPLNRTKLALVSELMTVYSPDKVTELFPAIINHNKWKKISYNDLLAIFQLTIPTKGVGTSVKIETQFPLPDRLTPTEVAMPFNFEQKTYYDRLIETCKKRNIKVVILVTPRMDWNYSFHNALHNYATEMGVDLLDLNLPEHYDQMDIEPTKDFFDFVHLNIAGTFKVSHYLGTLLNEKFDLPNHTGEAYFQNWDSDFLIYSQKYTRFLNLWEKSH